jgi:UTP--glucose-1-phosphate uridylyltransferase
LVLSGQRVDWEEVHKYGILEIKEGSENQLKALVEKPSKEETKSNFACYGRHVCTPKLFEYLDTEKTEDGKECYLSECINDMAQTEKVLVKEVDGEWLTTGDPLNMLKAWIKYALDREEYREEILSFMKNFK